MELHFWEDGAEPIGCREGGQVKWFLRWHFSKYEIKALVSAEGSLGMLGVIAEKVAQCNVVVDLHIRVSSVVKEVIGELIRILLF